MIFRTTRKLWMYMLVMTLCIVACTDDDIVKNGVDNVIDPPDRPVPTDDQMDVMVTADLSAYVHSAFDEGSTGAALVKRLPTVSNDFAPNTRLALFKGSDFDDGSTVTQAEIISMSRIYLKGGYIGLERPTVLQASKFLMALMVGVTTLKQQDLERTFGMSGTAAAAAARRSQDVERLNTRAENVRQMAQVQCDVTTRAEGKPDENEVMSEMLIFSPTGYFVQRPFEAESKVYVHSMDNEGNETEPQGVTVKTTRTPYISGQMADAAAVWLNDMLKPQGNPSAAPRRANAEGAINDLMSACETFTYSTSIDARNEKNETISYRDRMNMTVRSWNVHNTANNKDFYYLQQDVKLMMGDNKYGYGIFKFDDNSVNDWAEAFNYGDYNRWFGSFLSQYKTSMNLTGSGGTIKLEASAPNTENGGVTSQVMVMSDASQSESIGYALGGTGIGTELRGNAGGNLSWGTTDMTMFSVGDNTSVSALTRIAKTNKTMVSWTYKGSLPGYYEDDITEHDKILYCHEKPTAILVHDADVTQEICWSVANPTGAYTVNIQSTPQTAALLYQYKKDGKDLANQYEYTTSPTSNFSHTLLEPNRFIQTWRMYITIDEWMGEPVTGAMSNLESTLLDAFSDAYAAQIQVGDMTAESMDAINNVIQYCKNKFDQNYDVLQGYAKNLGIKKFSIYWRCDDRNIETKEPYVVEIPVGFKPGYVAQAIWCEGNKTFYFAYAPEIKVGDTWDGQTVDKVWAGSDVTHSSTTDYPEWWWELNAKTTRVVFDESFAVVLPRSCFAWFCYFSNIETIEGIGNLNTSEVTNMSYMFHSLKKVTALDVEGFDVSKVTDASEMFCICRNLETIYCSQTWNITASSDMFKECDKLKGAATYDRKKADCAMANPDTGYFTYPDLAGTITLNENSSNSTMLKRYEGQNMNVQYNRTLTAKIGDDGNYIATPFTVCLPYDLDLSAAVNDEQVEIYTLAAVSANSGQFTFAKLDITTLEAGMPYLLRVMKGCLGLSANHVTIKATKPKSTKVYSSLTQWRRQDGTEVGVWVGTFDNMSPDDAADESAYGLQASDESWSYYDYGGTATIPAFRCYLSSTDIVQKTYASRFTE